MKTDLRIRNPFRNEEGREGRLTVGPKRTIRLVPGPYGLFSGRQLSVIGGIWADKDCALERMSRKTINDAETCMIPFRLISKKTAHAGLSVNAASASYGPVLRIGCQCFFLRTGLAMMRMML